MRNRHNAFTLIELLVVVAIIALLAALLLPALKNAKAAAKAVQCVNNLRQIYVTLALYAEDTGGYLPPNATGAGNWHYVIGKRGYLGGSPTGPPWPVLRCPAEYQYQSNNGTVTSNYDSPFMRTSYAINFSFSYYDTGWARRAFGRDPDNAPAQDAPMVMDCPAWNVGWNAASFEWHVDDLFWAWDPYYPFRHPGQSANVLYLDGHIDRARSFALGQGPRIYKGLYTTTPCGTPFVGTAGCP